MGIYLDNAATTKISEKAYAAMCEAMRECYGNASSAHGMGLAASAEIEKARNMIGSCLSIDPARIVFTSGATESNNAALHHYATEGERKGRRHMVVSAIEHPSILQYCWYLKEHRGFELSVVDSDEFGVIRVEDVEKEIREDTCLVCVMAVNNETGMIQPFKEVSELCAQRKIPYHCDATQAVGHIPLGSDLPNASVSFSAHKFHGPKGVGCLVLPSELSRFNKLLHGGTQEEYRRAGTENVPAIIGMAVALVECCENGFFSSYIKSISDFIWDELRYKVGGVYLNGNRVQSVPHILNFMVEGVPSDVLVSMLSNVYGVYCSTGSACCSGESEPSHVLKAMGLSDEHALSSVRLSLSRYSTEQEAVFAINAIRECVLRLRGRVNAM